VKGMSTINYEVSQALTNLHQFADTEKIAF